MKKNLVITLVLVFVLSIVGTAFAATNPFVDVPAKHWAYDSIAKLAKAGIIDGYGDGTFRGDKTMTRYEMAVIVAKAMANQDKANAEQKTEINKLQTEFGDELYKLGVRVTALENKVGNIKLTGDVRERYEWTKYPDPKYSNPAEKTRLRLGMSAQLTDDLSFVGRYTAESASGGGTAQSYLDQAYLTGKVFGNSTFALGRLPVFLGKGLVYDSENRGTIQDGVSITTGGNTVKFTGVAFKTSQETNSNGTIPYYSNPLGKENIYAANVDWTMNKNLDMTFVYAKSKEDSSNDLALKTWAIGVGYNGIKNIGLTAEYGRNDSDTAKSYNNGSDPKAWMAKAKYLGADKEKPKSYGLWVGYRKIDSGFFNNSTLETTDAIDLNRYGTGLGLSNVKGLEYGFEYTVFRNGVLSLQYNNLKSNDGSDDSKKNFIAQLSYSF